MTLQGVPLLLLCTCFAALIAAEPARVREARQGLTVIPAATPMVISTTRMTTTSTSNSTTSSSSSSTQTSTATPTPTPTPPMLNFNVQNMTTCTSGVISWSYNGTQADLLLSIVGDDVPQASVEDLFRISARQSIIGQQLADTNTSVQFYTWPSVNLTEGWYEIYGLVLSTPTVSNYSQPFFITNGTDVSCLAASSSSTASKTKVASLVGGLVGALFAITLALIAGMCLWRRKRSPANGGGSKSQKWGSLKSNSSSVQSGNNGARAPNNHFHAHSESTGPILHNVAGVKASATSIDSPDGSDEDVEVVSDEKLISPTSSSGVSPFDALNTPARYDRRASAYSIPTPTTVASETSRTRVPSVLASPQTLEQQAQRIRSSMETSTRRRSERLSMPTLPPPAIISRLPPSPTCIPPQEEYPLTPVKRSGSTGATSMARRTSRKPVPQYDSSTLGQDKNGGTTDSVSTVAAGAESSSQSHGTPWGAGVNGTPLDLVRKASAGDGRPVHYLIPDMPPPQRDD